MAIPFLKMQGAANDFVVIDHRHTFLPADVSPLVRQWCDRRRGVGADGVLLLERSRIADAAMRYFNADGGAAEYCGNGARCMARYALDLGLGREGSVMLETAAGIQRGRRAGTGIEIHFGHVAPPSEPWVVDACGRSFKGRYVQSGVPHFVVETEALGSVDLDAWGSGLRHHARFGAAGANVDFVARRAAGVIAMRTYERGVEGETLACGSGAIASALWAAASGAPAPVRVATAGGDELIVGFMQDEDGYDVTLTGPAEVAFRGEWREVGESVPAAARGGA